jgi:predicted transcriptional regulator
MARPLRVEFLGAIYHVTARMLCRYAGLSQREVAEELHIGSGSAVSRQLTLLNDRLETDRELEKRVTTAERELECRRQRIRYK